MIMYPAAYKPINALQCQLFGHRLRSAQTKYEYLLEFLQVALSPKCLATAQEDIDCFYDMFPLDENIAKCNLSYQPAVRMGLKRFIFLPKGKMDAKANVDKIAYDECLKALYAKTLGSNDVKKANAIFVLQNLLGGFSATQQNRSWFDQNLLPICPEVILPESMGTKAKRKNMDFKIGQVDVDYEFSFNQYTYMCRGGEIYYLHLLNAINEFPQYKEVLEQHISSLLNSFPAFSGLSNFIQDTWDAHMGISSEDKKENQPKKNLGAIPVTFSCCNEYTLVELSNLLSSNCHPFEKVEMLANGLLLQMLRMMYKVAGTSEHSNYWLIDINVPDRKNPEAKKFAQSGFIKNEELLNTYIYQGYEASKEDFKDEENKVIRDAREDSTTLFRKLGKTIGVITPLTGPGMRFTLSEEIIKFLVLSIIPPKQMFTLDEFMELLHQHFGMVIGSYEYRIETGCSGQVAELSFLEDNKKAFAQKLKDCGFLRDLSDATSIVENPYEREVIDVCSC